MLTAEELFVALARDAIAIPVATAFARVALRSRQERLGFVYVQAILLACVAAVNAQRLATAVYWRDMALTSACEVLSLLAPHTYQARRRFHRNGRGHRLRPRRPRAAGLRRARGRVRRGARHY